MRLKVIVTALVVTGLAGLLLLALQFRDVPPQNAPARVKAQYGQRLLVGFSLTAMVWLGAAWGAMLIARQARVEFIEGEREALKNLIEGSLKDHQNRANRSE
ncbi:MAG: hypothetical protein ACK5XS_11260 [Armatimonadota bacterium]|jgi:hypothetical protein|nr:hypothetical protein CCB81_03350 [Armatimonadetes bacterium Uphvl-Ar2]MCE2939738.1 hypothetical protein [Fimbriimonadaceae bacterium]MCZ8138890.1 hypothetical protein [Fimbriimonadaceae bacterium]